MKSCKIDLTGAKAPTPIRVKVRKNRLAGRATNVMLSHQFHSSPSHPQIPRDRLHLEVLEDPVAKEEKREIYHHAPTGLREKKTSRDLRQTTFFKLRQFHEYVVHFTYICSAGTLRTSGTRWSWRTLHESTDSVVMKCATVREWLLKGSR